MTENKQNTQTRLLQTFFPVRLIFLLSIFIFHQFLYSQEEKDADWYLDEAQMAIMDEHYEYAIRILQEAKREFPEKSQFPIQLGDLYFNKDFYDFALKEYLFAEQIDAKDYYTLDQIQDCYAYLNQEYKAIEYLEKILKQRPPDDYETSIDTADDLGWMYFKTQQLEKGENLLLNILKNRSEYDENRGLAMTLGTLYSGMYDYDRSKEYYLKAIKEAEEDQDYYFASVAYYNLSLLEHTFYNFNSALQYTNDSIQSQDRATGHLSKGELYESRMNFPLALAEYEEGEKKDDTPLTKLNIANLLKNFGRLDDALSYTNSVYKSKDQSWMHNFGTDLDRHHKEIHKLLKDIYKGLANREITLHHPNIIEKTQSLVSFIWYSLLAYYHDQKFKNFSLVVGKKYLAEQDYLDAFWEFYMTNKEYPKVALKYLNKAEEIETRLIPKSKPSYLLEKGKITKNLNLLQESIASFDAFWEKPGIADSLLTIIKLLPRHSPERRNALNSLYEINPGAFLANGIGLPFEVHFYLSNKKHLIQRVIIHSLKNSGSDMTIVNSEKNPDHGYRFILEVYWNDHDDPNFILSDRLKEKIIKQGNIQVRKGSIDEQAVRFTVDMLQYHIYYVERNE